MSTRNCLHLELQFGKDASDFLSYPLYANKGRKKTTRVPSREGENPFPPPECVASAALRTNVVENRRNVGCELKISLSFINSLRPPSRLLQRALQNKLAARLRAKCTRVKIAPRAQLDSRPAFRCCVNVTGRICHRLFLPFFRYQSRDSSPSSEDGVTSAAKRYASVARQ